jgi:hypothetical protein
MTSPHEEVKELPLLSDFIAHKVTQFRGVCSLVHFLVMCKSHVLVVSSVVECRKSCNAAVEDKVMRLTLRGLGQPERQKYL